MLSAIFASPNWHQRQKNHALGVFLPTIPTWVQENHTEASIPYPLLSSRPVSIKTEIIVDGNASILDAVAHWTDAYGTPEPLQPPRAVMKKRYCFHGTGLCTRHGTKILENPATVLTGQRTTNPVSARYSGTTTSRRKMSRSRNGCKKLVK